MFGGGNIMETTIFEYGNLTTEEELEELEQEPEEIEDIEDDFWWWD